MEITLSVIISACALLCTIAVQLTRIAVKYGQMDTKLKNIESHMLANDERLQQAERSIINLKTDTAGITVLLSQMQQKVDRVDQKLDRLLEKL